MSFCKVIFFISNLFVQSNTASCCVYITRDIDRFLYLYQSIDPCVSCVFLFGHSFFEGHNPYLFFLQPFLVKPPPLPPPSTTFFWNISNPPILVTPLSKPIFFQWYFLLLIQLKSVRKIADLGFWIS